MTVLMDKDGRTKLACKEFTGALWGCYPECGGLHVGDDSLQDWLEDAIEELVGNLWDGRYRITVTVKVEKLEEAKE